MVNSKNVVSAMRKLFILAATSLALFAQSCATDNTEGFISEKTTTISIEADGGDLSRTYVDNDIIRWHESGEQLNVIYYADDNSSSRKQTSTHQDYTVVDNRITFTADFTPVAGATTYTLGAFYPYAYKYTTSSISLNTLSEQTPTEDSYDPAGDILVSKEPIVVSGTPDKVKFTFARLVAFAKMTIKGIPAGEKISEVVFSSPAKPVGAVTFKVHESGTLDNAVWYNNYEDITLNMGNRVATGEDAVWFTTVPTDLSGTSFKVTVITDKNNYVKEVDLTGKTLTFERANIAKFTVKDLVVQEKPKAYKLLTDVAELNAGDQVIIVNKKIENSSVKVMMRNQHQSYSNRLGWTSDYTAITSGIEILDGTLPENSAIFTVESGATSGTFAFKEASAGYLCGQYDAENWTYVLTYTKTMDPGASWTVELISNGAKMSSSYDGVATARYLNNYDGYSINYASSRSTSYHYYIFYMDGESSGQPEQPEQPEQPIITPLATPVVTATASANSITVSWAAVAGAKDYTVTCGAASQTVTATTATFANLEYATDYTISVVANPADSTVNSASEAGTAKVTTEAAQGGADGLMVALTLPVEGAVVDATANTFYEGDITISSTGGWRIQSEGSSWTGLYLGSGKYIKVAVADSSKHEITKVEMTAEASGTLNFKDFTAGSTLVWEPGYGASSKTFNAGGATRVATITVYYKAK